MGSGMLKIRNFSCSYIEEGEIVPKLEGDKKTETLRWYRIIKAMVKVLNENGIDFKPWNM